MVRQLRVDSGEHGHPWQRGVQARSLAFVALWATGDDTSIDGLVKIEALRSGTDGSWSLFERLCRPFEHERDRSASARAALEFGVDVEALETAARDHEAWSELLEFLGDAEVVVASHDRFLPWAQHLRGAEEALDALGLDEFERLLLPSRATRHDAHEVRRVRELPGRLAGIVRRFRELPEHVRALATAAWSECHQGLSISDPTWAARLARALELVDRPSRWLRAADAPLAGLGDDVLTSCVAWDPRDAAEFVRERIDDASPRWAEIGAAWREYPTVPVTSEDAHALDESDLAWIDEVFQVHLPAAFRQAEHEPSYRKGQHDVARQVARTFGTGRLLLVHAPTGTGKTLSYLVPALLWSLRNHVRVAISTYTRALQEQAVDNEVPRALSALAHAGLELVPRVTVVKGRTNYLCWRALRLHVPSEGDDAQSWLAWTSLMMFAFLDDDGDLDRFPTRSVLSASSRATHQRELDTLVRSVRAQIGCCRSKDDRETCAADVARQRAERSHLIITNHAFSLVQPTYFKHVVFDECEHLHDQAGNAWSWSVTLREIREFLVRLRQPGRPHSRAALDRLERFVLDGDPAYEAFESARQQWFAALGALDALQVALDQFKAWRDAECAKRANRDEHSLLREFVLGLDPAATPHLDPRALHGARALVTAHAQLVTAASELDAALAQVTSTLDTIRAKGMARIRRALELARGDMLEWLEALRNFIPTSDGRPAFAPERFYDVEQDARGDDMLVARVLLPNELLGRSYYPQLSSAVMISATTWLRGGFDVARTYLGLDRAAQPLENEEREPSVVETFRAADPFDYSRVCVCVPDDFPDPARARDSFQAQVRRFVAHLAERTRGRVLVLFTNSDEVRRTGEELSGFFRARGLPLYFQNMTGVRKEELGSLFRERVDSTLLGVDTFWYGADFPGETLEYLVIVKLPYGVPDRYHHAQCAALGASEQRRRIYLPRALAKFRQGFGRLMRRESDRGCVFVLDPRVLHGANKLFLGELPIQSDLGRSEDAEWTDDRARFVSASTEQCLQVAFAHMGLLDDIHRRGLDTPLGNAASAPGLPLPEALDF